MVFYVLKMSDSEQDNDSPYQLIISDKCPECQQNAEIVLWNESWITCDCKQVRRECQIVKELQCAVIRVSDKNTDSLTSLKKTSANK